jgi:hypothetical protein
MKRIAAVLVLALCAARPLAAQWSVEAGLAGTREIVHSRAGATAARFAGAVLGGDVAVKRGPFAARLRYAQGRVSHDSIARDLAEGEALLGYAPLAWLEISVGPAARTFVAPGLSDRRWLFWTGRVSARGAIFPGRLGSFVELWQGLSGRLSRPASSARGRGLELGLEARLPGKPVWGRLAYRIEQGRASGGIKETVEGFALTVGYSRK